MFRGDIQGLRAVAVLLVALDHARIGPFHGGFVGVDVFFVISGFLITSLLLTEAVRDGRISLTGFYARRARRILPAATVVTLATIGASVLFLSGVDALGAIEDAVWATFFAANIKFASDGTDYFQNEAAPSPLQHYWSLAVEEQFYLVWPLLVLALCLLVRRRRSTRGRHAARRTSEAAPHAGVTRAAVVLLTAVVLASFAWSVLDTRSDAVPAYFSPFTRAWELGLGALTACLVPTLRRAPRQLLGVVSWLGLAGVLAAALTYDPETLFPGSAAALPVVGTAFLLAGGLVPTPWGPQRLLTVRPMRAVGDWSYSFYLWHWPALILAGAIWGPLSATSGLVVLAGALALSAASYELVENPVRRMRLLATRPARGLVLYPAVVVLMLPLMSGAQAVVEKINTTTGDWITTTNYGRHRGDPKPDFSRDPAVALVEASVQAARNGAEIPRGLSPAPLAADARKPDVGKCEYYPGFKDMLCPRGDLSADRTLVLVGDSHARQWIPALDVLTKKYGYKAYYLVRVGCPGADVTPWLKVGGPSLNCEKFQDWAVDQVEQLQPDITIIGSESSSNRGYVDDNGDLVDDPDETLAMFGDGMERSVTRLAAHSGRVVYIGDPPATDFQVSVCLSKHDASLRSCMAARDPRSLEMTAAAKAGALKAGADYIDPTPWFCEDDSCPAVVGHFVPRRDLAHITVEYAEHLTPALDRALSLKRSAGPARAP